MTTYRAVVKYRLDATNDEKIRALRDGLECVATELIELGCSFEKVQDWLQSAEYAAEDEARMREHGDH